MLFSEIIE
ncbi:hypothetical protein Ahy_A06g029119 isoform D [Arachis hypogaea]|uniref:Uncharacterized protein n=1 Tax=Arachis hypogaea TaxID=3818 RepID=A0A445CSG8_ARAHY|nr:hypothetical protein Ahy_A06g029119 isoform D [Arachis hypogaea]